jgi:hypothetical protein
MWVRVVGFFPLLFKSLPTRPACAGLACRPPHAAGARSSWPRGGRLGLLTSPPLDHECQDLRFNRQFKNYQK